MDENALLTHRGLVVAIILMIIFTPMNLAGAKFMSEGNSIVVIWKTAVPLLAIGVIASLSFHTSNFTAGGGFMPYGWHGVFAALPGGVVFALQGFEQAAQMAGEAKNPKRDLSRAILISMGIGALLYTLLQVVMIAGVQPSDVANGWQHPLGKDPSDYGAWYTLALSVGATWLATVLIIDAVVSPAGTGIVYVGTSARLSYALGEEEEMPSALASTRNGVPVVSILLAAVVGIIAFGPFKSWNSLVNVVTGATAIMYAFAPVALVALHRTDSDRPRPYSCPMPRIVLPAAFCSANLIIYWGGFNYTWKLACALVLGLVLFAIGSTRADTNPDRGARERVVDRPVDRRHRGHRCTRSVRRWLAQLPAGVDRPAGRHRLQPGDLLPGRASGDHPGGDARGDRKGRPPAEGAARARLIPLLPADLASGRLRPAATGCCRRDRGTTRSEPRSARSRCRARPAPCRRSG